MSLVQHCPASHGQVLAQQRVGEDSGHTAGKAQVLFDLAALGPRRMRLPSGSGGIAASSVGTPQIDGEPYLEDGVELAADTLFIYSLSQIVQLKSRPSSQPTPQARVPDSG